MPYITSVERLAREEGIEQGKRSGLLLGLESLLRLKFGQAGHVAFEEVRQIEDVALLEALLRQVPTATSLDEARALYKGSRS